MPIIHCTVSNGNASLIAYIAKMTGYTMRQVAEYILESALDISLTGVVVSEWRERLDRHYKLGKDNSPTTTYEKE